MAGATAEGTRGYIAAQASAGVLPEHFREAQGLWFSSVGIGTYLGAHDEATDELYRRAVGRAVDTGVNVIDTAINYRYQRSERAIRRALGDLFAAGRAREEVLVATKGGFIPGDGDPPRPLEEYVEREFFATGILRPEEVVSGCHALAPRYIAHQIDQSLSNLGLETIDIYYLHNPETQLAEIPRDEFHRRMRATFESLETAAAEGKIQYYGTATWNAYRQPPGARDYVSLDELVALARDIAGSGHRFRFVQLPYNLGMTEAFTARHQSLNGRDLSLLQAAEELGLSVIASASIAQGRLTQGLPSWLGTLFRGLATDAQRSIQFARSTPGITTALVGMKELAHVKENLLLTRVPPVSLEDFLKLFEVDRGG